LEDAAALEEERRLCYVGMTRAKDRLTLSWAQRRRSFGKESFEGTDPSRFLTEVPADLLESLDGTSFASRARTVWENAVNSVASAERFLRERGREFKAPVGSGKSSSLSASRGRWKLGTQVRHAKYGVGTILECEGGGEDTKLTVSFPGYGQKKLMERYASLEKL
jgi:DNA helicase-2/ATP-dependent DNA helicase PcrA